MLFILCEMIIIRNRVKHGIVYLNDACWMLQCKYIKLHFKTVFSIARVKWKLFYVSCKRTIVLTCIIFNTKYIIADLNKVYKFSDFRGIFEKSRASIDKTENTNL